MNEQKVNSWPRYAVYSLVVIIILLLILLLVLYLVRSPLLYRSSAYSTTSGATQTGVAPTLSLDNSYIFASPLRAKAGGEKIRITVFILDSRGLGLVGKKVTIGSGSSLLSVPIQPVTDGQGRATFDISANSVGVYIITAAADGVDLTQKANISFD